MFIKVKYGDNETLVCNPSCAAINLLHSIKRQTGYSDRTISVDLSDEKGLVQELETHKYESASTYLTSPHRTYILVQKQALSPIPDDVTAGDGKVEQYEYIPLLNNCLELFPDYKLQVQANDLHPRKPLKRPIRVKAPSPAGLKVAKGDKRVVPKKR